MSPCCGCHFPRQLSRSIINGPGPQFEVEEGVLEWEEFKSSFYDHQSWDISAEFSLIEKVQKLPSSSLLDLSGLQEVQVLKKRFSWG